MSTWRISAKVAPSTRATTSGVVVMGSMMALSLRDVADRWPSDSYLFAVFCCSPSKFCLDEAVDIAIQDRLYVAGLERGPMILDHLIGVKDIGPDLGTKPDVALLSSERGHLSFALFVRSRQ